MKTAALVGALLLGLAAGTAAQVPPRQQPPMDTSAELPLGPGQDDPRVRELRRQVEMRFGMMVREQLQLSEPQMQQLREAMQRSGQRRRALNQREAELRRQIARQMQPGVAADTAELNRLLEQQGRLRVERAESDEQFRRELTFLTPVQQVHLFRMIGNLEQRMQQIRQRQAMEGGNRRPGRQ